MGLVTVNLELGWGRDPLHVELPGNVHVLQGPQVIGTNLVSDLLTQALDSPISISSFSELIGRHRRLCILIPDETRKDIASCLLPLLEPHLRGSETWVGVAPGKHPYKAPLGDRWRHDATADNLVTVGTTTRGTRVEFPQRVLDADLRICLGEIRPHYFAGYAGGAKTLFPGVAGEQGIWTNHLLKSMDHARLGQVDDNPCRLDMEEAAAMAGPSFIINLIRDAKGAIADIVAGDPIAAHREGVRRARPYFEVPVAQRFKTVIVSDKLPVTMNLYQACKLLPPAGNVLEEGGTVILAAECTDGIGPVETINEAIYKLGCIHSLPKRHRVLLVSRHAPDLVAPTFAEYAPDVVSALAMVDQESLAVIPYGGELIPRLMSTRGSP